MKLNESDPRMFQNVFLVLGLDIFVLEGLTSLKANPTRALVTFNMYLQMLNEANDPGHIGAPFKRKFSICLHLPSSAGVTL